MKPAKRNPLIAGMKIYIAGPYTNGDVAVNVRNAIEAGNALFEEGAVPFIPHLTHFWHMICPQDHIDWLYYDTRWLGCCDMLLRLNGESEGADEEVATALALNIPVYYDINDLLLGEAR